MPEKSRKKMAAHADDRGAVLPNELGLVNLEGSNF